MDQQWLEDAIAEVDRQGPRPGFEAELRSTLNEAWTARPAERSTRDRPREGPRRAGWMAASAAALVALAVGAVLVTTQSEPDMLVSPQPRADATSDAPADSTSDTTADPPIVGDVAALVDRTWLITQVDGVARDYAAAFSVDANGMVEGFDGCNFYSTPMSFTVDGLGVAPGGEGSMTLQDCNDPYDTGWVAEPGAYTVDGDTLTIRTADGRRFDAVDNASLPTLDDAGQLLGTWATAEGLEVTFMEPLGGVGVIALACIEFGSWTFQGDLRTVIDDAAYGSCVAAGEPGLGWVLSDLASGFPTVRILPDGSLIFGRNTFGRLFPTDTTPSAAGESADLTVPVRVDAPVETVALATIRWGTGDGQLPVPTTDFGNLVALFPDSVLVLEDLPQAAGPTGRAIRLDRVTGALVDEVRIDEVTGPPFWASGSPDGTLYLATGVGDVPGITVSALRETTPGMFTVVEQTTRDALGDSEFRLTGRGLELGGDVLFASNAAATWPRVTVEVGTGQPAQPLGSRWIVSWETPQTAAQTWTVDVNVDQRNPPGFDVPFAEPFGNGVLFSTATSTGSATSPSLSYLAGPGELSGSWDLGAWQLGGQDPDAALFVRLGSDGLELGWLDVSVSPTDRDD